MEHHIIYKRDGVYAAFPQLDHLKDGRVAAGFSISFKRDHHVIGDWTVLASEDGGRTWSPSGRSVNTAQLARANDARVLRPGSMRFWQMGRISARGRRAGTYGTRSVGARSVGRG